MSEQRKPAAFRVTPKPESAKPTAEKAQQQRTPRAVSGERLAEVVPAEIDVFDLPEDALVVPPPAVAPRKRSRLGAIFISAFGILVSLAIGVWMDGLVRELFSRADWLGWVGVAVSAVAVMAAAAILARELAGLARLRSVEKLRGRASDAISRNDPRAAHATIDELAAFASAQPETAAGRRVLADLKGEIIDAADLIRLAETEILAPLDRRAQTLILDAAKRVSVVTAISPRAFVDIAYVLFEAGRLIRRIATLYGARPGTLGFVRLARDVIAHLAVTGVIAAGDDFVHQVVGQGLAARLSAKLGEGVVNGMMTARIGLAAMETTRPLPFSAIKRPGMTDFLAALTRFAREKGTAGEKAPN